MLQTCGASIPSEYYLTVCFGNKKQVNFTLKNNRLFFILDAVNELYGTTY